MLIDINLLPPDQRNSSSRNILGFMAAIIGGIFCIWSSYAYCCLVQAEQMFHKGQTAYALLKPTVDQQSALQFERSKISEKTKILAELSQQNDSGYTFLVSLGCLITEDVWLREVVRVDQDVWLLKGEMTSYQHLVNFIERFSQDTIFSVPEIQQVSTDGGVPTFELRIKLRE